MTSTNAVWGIEVGQCALRAVKLRPADDGKVELAAFDMIEHPKILSQPDAEPEELIKAALEKFASRNEWNGDKFVIGVPGQQTFSRFCKLPPVDEKKVPDIVRFEATQQIPFDMNDVVWDYQVFRTPDSPDLEVGIFAMRRDLVRKQIDYYNAVGITPSIIQTIPSALYNFCRYDETARTSDGGGATVIVDVGAQKTDLIVVEPNGAWSRNIPLGGNSFTEALVKSFKLSFAKAEQLKRTAADSKHARQVFQAMRPVFAELVAEIQRSIGYYSSAHRDVELRNVLVCGNAFRLPGLKKYLENNLSIPEGVVELEKFNKLITTQTANAPQFTENILAFGPAFGLAVQGLGLASISANLLPPELARVAMWRQKQPWFAAAAASLVLAAVLPWTRGMMDSSALASNKQIGDDGARLIANARSLQTEFTAAQTDTGSKKTSIDQLFDLQTNKAMLPLIYATIHEAFPRVPEFESARTPADLRRLIESNPARFQRQARRQFMIQSVRLKYSRNIDAESRDPMGPSGDFIASGGFSSPAASFAPPMGRSGGFRSGGGDGVVGDGGGGGSYGEFSSPSGSPEEGGDAEAPGFWVYVTGRMTFGRTQSEAIGLIAHEVYENLRRLGRRAGLGFHIPETDAKDPQNLNLPAAGVMPFIDPIQAAQPAFGGGRFGGDGTMSGAVPGVETGPRFRDPITGEDESTDWTFSFGFKIKLGEMPQEEAPAPTDPGRGE